MSKKRILNLSDRELLFLSWPIFIELFLRVIIGNINVWMISHYSEPAVAAVSAANQLLNLSVFIYGFITVGTQIIIAQLIGAKRQKDIPTVINTALFASLGIGLLISLSFFCFADPLLQIMGLDHSLVEIGRSYLQIYGGSLFISSLIAVIVAIMRSHGYTQPALLIPMTASILAWQLLRPVQPLWLAQLWGDRFGGFQCFWQYYWLDHRHFLIETPRTLFCG